MLLVTDALGPFVGAISVCELRDWPHPDNAPDDWADVQHDTVGLLYSPETVRSIVEKFGSVPRKRLEDEIENAWPKMSEDPADYLYTDPGYFDDASDFVGYFTGWFHAVEEAAGEGYGIAIAGG